MNKDEVISIRVQWVTAQDRPANKDFWLPGMLSNLKEFLSTQEMFAAAGFIRKIELKTLQINNLSKSN